MEYIPKYKKAQPDKSFRKDPKTFLGNQSWLDEIISTNGKGSNYENDESIVFDEKIGGK